MAKGKKSYSSNINPNEPFEFVNGMCSDEYKGESYKKIMDAEAPDLDMSKCPHLPDIDKE